VEAKEADHVRRNFRRKWDERTLGMQLPATLRAFGVPVEGPGGNQKPTAVQLRKAYRQVTYPRA
jgi:hypothetical protein